MTEIEIKRHSFDLAKNRLKEFSEKTEAKLKIDQVRTEGDFFGLGDHKVTGYELNRSLETIQELFVSVNSTNNKVIKEFREVYNALDILDKDYITSIITNIKAIEKTSNDVRIQQGVLKQHNERLANQQSKLDEHQKEIRKNIDNISKIVTILKAFKEKLEGYSHLTEIDIIWNNCKTLENEIESVSDSIRKFSNKATENFMTIDDHLQNLTKDIQTQQSELDDIRRKGERQVESIDILLNKMDNAERFARDSRGLINKLEDFRVEVSSLNHLMEVDDIWEKIEAYQIRIGQMEKENEAHVVKMNELEQTDYKMYESINSNTHNINLLKEYKDKLCRLSHLDDVDKIWMDIGEHTLKLIECEKNDKELLNTIYRSKEVISERVAEIIQISNSSIMTLTKKVKYAYWIAGSAAGLAIIELILFLLRMI